MKQYSSIMECLDKADIAETFDGTKIQSYFDGDNEIYFTDDNENVSFDAVNVQPVNIEGSCIIFNDTDGNERRLYLKNITPTVL